MIFWLAMWAGCGLGGTPGASLQEYDDSHIMGRTGIVVIYLAPIRLAGLASDASQYTKSLPNLPISCALPVCLCESQH